MRAISTEVAQAVGGRVSLFGFLEGDLPKGTAGKGRSELRELVPLGRDFYIEDTLEVTRALLGKFLVRLLPEGPAGGLIVEAEAYLTGDPANHAFKGKTSRNAPMFGPPGYAYVYRIHNQHCLNVVTRPEGIAEAVLIRAIEPAFGVGFMLQRRKKVKDLRLLSAGPGRLCQALEIDLSFNGHDLTKPPLFIAEGVEIPDSLVRKGPRIGVTANKDKPWRFYIEGNPFLSKP